MKKKVVVMALVVSAVLGGCKDQEAKEAAEAAVVSEEGSTTEEAKDNLQEEAESEAKPAREEAGQEEKESEAKPAWEEAGQGEKKKTEYVVTVYEEAKVMYASGAVNVRKGPSVEFERVGGLNYSQEVTVTGQADTGWYEILLGDAKGYVSNQYLQDEKPQPQQTQQQTNAAVTEVKDVAGVIMVGDSRFVQMQENIGANSCTWIAENGKGYNWLNETAMARIDGCVGKGSRILINLGVNDPEYVSKYLELVNAKAAEWTGKGARVYYASVNPVWENPYTTEDEVHAFNAQMQSGLSGDVHWIDSHTYLESIGFKLVDGLHYNAETYQNIFAYYMSCL